MDCTVENTDVDSIIWCTQKQYAGWQCPHPQGTRVTEWFDEHEGSINYMLWLSPIISVHIVFIKIVYNSYNTHKRLTL